ncbi:GNAT family N-acetyltransferase [Promicromonospora iranensis]|uniref:RimJ/RimL family protein N-acetyltransferase n=1 Tax=Promicromonospora iranensis TaxID=1105144 RepID=A0ABU2CHD1_9MICO|nr:GNAT family N-acetyltransferase [Promicromonospora iranensis]MDR7380722.1 RimJ/RimL family protein N-acetyltransferase [Promicromonospora iranensis]
MTTPHWPLTTERLELRPVTPADADAFLAWRSRPEVARYMFQPPWTPELATRKLIDWSGAPFSLPGDVLVLAVVERAGRSVIGEVLLKWAHGTGQAEVGYGFRPEVAGSGYATEAVRAALGLAFDVYGFHRVFARIDEENTRSSRVCERLGMRLEARLVESDIRPDDGAWATELNYAVLASEHVSAGR